MKLSVASRVSVCLLASLSTLASPAVHAGEAKNANGSAAARSNWEKTGLGDLPEPKNFEYTPSRNPNPLKTLLGFAADFDAVKAYAQVLADAGYVKKEEKTVDDQFTYRGFKDGNDIAIQYRLGAAGGTITYRRIVLPLRHRYAGQLSVISSGVLWMSPSPGFRGAGRSGAGRLLQILFSPSHGTGICPAPLP